MYSQGASTTQFAAHFVTKNELPHKRSCCRAEEDKENEEQQQQPQPTAQQTGNIREQQFAFLGKASRFGFPMPAYFQPGIDGGSLYRQYTTQQQPTFISTSTPASSTHDVCRNTSNSGADHDSGFHSDLSLNISGRPTSPCTIETFQGHPMFSAQSPLFLPPPRAMKVELPIDVNPEQEFCKTPSRTALLTSKQLSVSVGEIHRRIFGPEMLNISILGAYLRKAKEKSGGKALRDDLKQYGMNLPSGRRKNGVATTWTCFVEEETQQMAVDLDEATRRHFPVRNCAQTLLRRLSSEDPQNLHIMVDNTRRILGELAQIFREDKSPTHGRENHPSTLDKSLQNGFYNFSCVTHGFGMPAYIAAINVVQSVLDALAQENAMVLGQRANFYGAVDPSMQPGPSTVFGQPFTTAAYLSQGGCTS
uniref:Transcription factor AP-2-epsilon n=1 Tax=Ascaris suum TaxID=6253 RepID=F1L0R9_ASCSU